MPITDDTEAFSFLGLPLSVCQGNPPKREGDGRGRVFFRVREVDVDLVDDDASLVLALVPVAAFLSTLTEPAPPGSVMALEPELLFTPKSDLLCPWAIALGLVLSSLQITPSSLALITSSIASCRISKPVSAGSLRIEEGSEVMVLMTRVALAMARRADPWIRGSGSGVSIGTDTSPSSRRGFDSSEVANKSDSVGFKFVVKRGGAGRIGDDNEEIENPAADELVSVFVV